MAVLSPFPNLADQRGLQKRIDEELLPLLRRIREERRARLHPQWLRHDRMWKMMHDEGQAYKGRLASYLPIARRIAENWTQKVKGDLFPRAGRYFRAIPKHLTADQHVATIETLYTQALRQMQLRRKMGPGIRTLLALGTVPFDLGWQTIEHVMPRLVPTLGPLGQPTGETQEELQKVVEYLGPTFRQPDLFLWYVWPYTVLDVRDATIVLEDQLISRSEVEALLKTPIDPNNPDAGMQFENGRDARELLAEMRPKRGRPDEDKFAAEVERLAQRGLKSRLHSTDVDPETPMDITVGYWRTTVDQDQPDQVLDAQTREMTQVGPGKRWYQFAILGDKVLVKLRRNPWWWIQPSYLAAKFVERDNDFYGYSLLGVIDHLQYVLNDTLNQAGDALTWSMNPIVAIDPFAVQDTTSIRMRPGARWLMKNPRESVNFAEPPKDTPAIGFTAVQQLIALMNDVSNVAPFSGGGSGGPRSRGRGLNTAAGMQIVLSEAMVQVQDVVENFEDQVFNPMMAMVHASYQQCLDRDQWVRVAGMQGAMWEEHRVTRADLAGDFDWDWLGSTSSYNVQVKGQQLITMLQVLARIPPQAYRDKAPDLAYLIGQIWTVGMEMQDVDRLLRPISMQQPYDPTAENTLFQLGRGLEVTVSPADDDLKHAQVHDQVLQDPSTPPQVQQMVVQHIRAHMAAHITKQLLQQHPELVQQAQQQAGQGAAPADQQAPGQDTPGQMTNGRTTMPNAPGRLASTTSPDDVMRRQPRLGSTAVQ